MRNGSLMPKLDLGCGGGQVTYVVATFEPRIRSNRIEYGQKTTLKRILEHCPGSKFNQLIDDDQDARLPQKPKQ
ncbi:hypothetical protein DERF_014279 [Dermatophagoides farinae]|uniref:Uncharacterized protein n=1 Tax=Dermatophagoides farinae TaxID=6954 RepID=A0A922HMM3_DERFA|nr:hypothetical protein DERF_014279 [Dermatophagoides farinae]